MQMQAMFDAEPPPRRPAGGVLGVTLRDYQEDALAAVAVAERDGCRRQALVLPTGAGKTVVFAALIARRGERALVLAHRDELIEQAVAKIRAVAPGCHVGVVKAERDDAWAPVVVASVQTLSRGKRLARVGRFGLVVTDEMHHAAAPSYRTIYDALGAGEPDGPLHVGVTATPDRGDRVRLDDVFDRIVYQVGLLDLMLRGYLCDARAVRVQLERLDLDGVRRTGGDYAEGALEAALEDADQPANTAAAVLEHAADRKAIVFTASVKLAQETAAELCAVGVAAEWVAGEMPGVDRRAVLARFRAGTTRVVVNCMVLTEGFDEPAVDCVVIARPTTSRSLYQQMAGRGLRPYPDKADCLLIDVVGVTERHDLQTSASLAGVDFAAKGDGDEETLTGAVAKQGPLVMDPVTGRMVAVPVDLFGKSRMAWRKSAKVAAWTLPLDPESALVMVPGVIGLDVIRLDTRAGGVEVVERGLDAAAAHGWAEDKAAAEGAAWLTNRNARWRRDDFDPDGKQAGLARTFRVDLEALRGEDGRITKGAVSEAIDAAKVDRRITAYLRGTGRAA